MGQGYTRNDASNNIANGNVINASDLDGEFDAIVDAFASGTGHTHDGTAAEGGAITVVGPAQEYIGDGVALYPKLDATYDLGKTASSFNVAYIESLNLGGTVVTATAAELNTLDGVTTATAANYRAANADKLLVADEVWASGAVVPLTDGVAISVDMATGFNFSVTLGGNRTLLNPSNPKVGQTGFIRVAQDGTGSRTLTLSTSYVTQGGGGVALTDTPGAVDVLFYCVLGTTEILITQISGIS